MNVSLRSERCGSPYVVCIKCKRNISLKTLYLYKYLFKLGYCMRIRSRQIQHWHYSPQKRVRENNEYLRYGNSLITQSLDIFELTEDEERNQINFLS